MFKNTAFILFNCPVQHLVSWEDWVDKLKIPPAFTFVPSKFSSAIFIVTVALLSTVGRGGLFPTQTDTTRSYLVGK